MKRAGIEKSPFPQPIKHLYCNKCGSVTAILYENPNYDLYYECCGRGLSRTGRNLISEAEEAGLVITPKEAAAAIGCDVHYVYFLIDTDEIQAKRHRKGWRIPISEAERVAKQRKKTEPPRSYSKIIEPHIAEMYKKKGTNYMATGNIGRVPVRKTFETIEEAREFAKIYERPKPPEGALTLKEAGERLGVTASRISQYMKDGRLKGQKYGFKYAIEEKEIERLMREKAK